MTGVFATPDGALAWVLIGGGSAIALVVFALLVRALVSPAQPVRERRWIVGGGVVFPAVVLATLGVLNVQSIDRLFAAPPSAPVVAVQGRRWWWRVEHAEGVVGANRLVLEAGRPTRLALAGPDVIHSLWVPELGGKMDLVPGRTTHLVLEPREPGAWRAPCAEFCGEGHARMVLEVVALAPAEHAAWLAHERSPARPPADARQARGRDAFVALGCGHCHTVRGVVRQTVDAGPDLTHLAARAWLGAGAAPNDRVNLRRWIADPQALKPGVEMPGYAHLDAATLDALVAWLASLE